MVNVDITGFNNTAGLVGSNGGTITACYVTGSVSGGSQTGGLVGLNLGKIITCYSTVNVTTPFPFILCTIGSLVGDNLPVADAGIIACYATGSVTGVDGITGGLIGSNSGTIEACYATGSVSVTGTSSNVGGLVGQNGGAITNSYFDSATTGQGSGARASLGRTTYELVTPTGYGTGTDTYANWNVDVDNADADDDFASGTDNPWDFGTSGQYPALRVDFDKDGIATVSEFGPQGR